MKTIVLKPINSTFKFYHFFAEELQKDRNKTRGLYRACARGSSQMLHLKVLRGLFKETEGQRAGRQVQTNSGQQPALELGRNPVFHNIPTLTFASKELLSSDQLPLLPALSPNSAKGWLGFRASFWDMLDVRWLQLSSWLLSNTPLEEQVLHTWNSSVLVTFPPHRTTALF